VTRGALNGHDGYQYRLVSEHDGHDLPNATTPDNWPQGVSVHRARIRNEGVRHTWGLSPDFGASGARKAICLGGDVSPGAARGVDVRPPASECADRRALARRQGARLRMLLDTAFERSAFYRRKLEGAGFDAAALGRLDLPDGLAALPFTSKSELVADQEAHPPWGTVWTEPLERYTRYNQTSSTTGARPLRWADTTESWQWMVGCWKAVYRAARVGPQDRVFFAFSFGPFLGFWTAFDAACDLGAQAIPSGGMTSQQRLTLIEALRPTVLCCTPTYALRLAEVAYEDRTAVPLAAAGVRTVIVAGEPGGSIPATRNKIEARWGARVIDHHGLTEVGPVSFECWESPGFLHVNENEYVCEVIDPSTLGPAPDGARGELVLTNLGRSSGPAIRYRTGDLVVRRTGPCACGRTLARLEGGILARADDMVTIRGVNVYPAAIEGALLAVDGLVEFRATVTRTGALPGLEVEIETGTAFEAATVAAAAVSRLRDALSLTVQVRTVPPGALPRFEMKARRFVVQS
jgi:phenylacetate-CoA ligase